MNAKFDPSQPFSKVYGSSPAAHFQNGHYFSGDGSYLSWAQASGEVEVPTTAAETEIQSREAAERIANREKAESRVQTERPYFDSRTLVGQPSPEAVVEKAITAVPAGRVGGALSLDELASGIKETSEASKLMAAELNSEGKTNAELGKLTGVARRAVTDRTDRTKGGHVNTSIDRRVKVPKKEHPMIVKRLEAGETQARVAADYGISQRQVSNIATRWMENSSIDLP